MYTSIKHHLDPRHGNYGYAREIGGADKLSRAGCRLRLSPQSVLVRPSRPITVRVRARAVCKDVW